MTDPRPNTPPGDSAGRDGNDPIVKQITDKLYGDADKLYGGADDPDPILCERCGSSMELIGPFAAHQLPYFKCPVCGRRA